MGAVLKLKPVFWKGGKSLEILCSKSKHPKALIAGTVDYKL